MKRKIIYLAVVMTLLCGVGITGCGKKDKEDTKVTSSSKENQNINIVKRVYQEYEEDEMGLWESNGITYQYKKELTGEVPSSDEEVTFVILTNDDAVTFEQVFDSMYSSDSNKRLDDSMTLIVEIK